MSIIGSAQPALKPLVAPLPDPPETEAFTPEQWATLMAIMDTVVPSVQRGTKSGGTATQQTLADAEYNKAAEDLKKAVVGPVDDKAIEDFLGEKPSANPRFQALLRRSMIAYSREDVRKNLTLVLSALK